MPAAEGVFMILEQKLKGTDNRLIQDRLLDIWVDYRDRATEWDADKWGFNPDRWMKREREQMGMMPLDERRLRTWP